ncbi:beta-1,4-N-acetylgalactosaminyltransferase bre-4-like [Pecten maximus]|uniref:beta-1,4-N-acetylgalactosaminyltransferase bre-4-like n=1 Tax=Pecten maximus TaxID=6579 RepID=UPI00145871C2|nr:beta-1,4-N-acetylgalactosaminyltransferase bre-4-like [Pecten maximus]
MASTFDYAIRMCILAMALLIFFQARFYFTMQKQSKRISTDISLIRNYSGRIQEQLAKVYNFKNVSAVTMVIPKGNGTETLPKCPETPPNLVGPLKTYQNPPSLEKMELELDYLNPGGHYVPLECRTNQRVAIVIPYRNRPIHLRTVLYNLHHMLPRQQLDYGIFVIEQAGDNTFNRGLLMNIGFVEALHSYNFTCFVFHDVDLIPEDDRIYYGCGTGPRHLSAAIDKFSYRLPYPSIAGGVTQLRRTDFEKINGFSNLFFGWGGEDDDLSTRMRAASLKMQRYSMTISRYKMIKHQQEKSNPTQS